MTHYDGVLFFQEFARVLQLRRCFARHLHYARRNQRYELSRVLLALIYPIILGLDRLETAALLQGNGAFQYLTGLPSHHDPQSLRHFLHQAVAGAFWLQERVQKPSANRGGPGIPSS